MALGQIGYNGQIVYSEVHQSFPKGALGSQYFLEQKRLEERGVQIQPSARGGKPVFTSGAPKFGGLAWETTGSSGLQNQDLFQGKLSDMFFLSNGFPTTPWDYALWGITLFQAISK